MARILDFSCIQRGRKAEYWAKTLMSGQNGHWEIAADSSVSFHFLMQVRNKMIIETLDEIE